MAQVLTVGRGFGKLSIDEAFEKAEVGDRVEIQPGEYTPSKSLRLSGLTVVGLGQTANDVKIFGGGFAQASANLFQMTFEKTSPKNNVLNLKKGAHISCQECVFRNLKSTDYPVIYAENGVELSLTNCQVEANSKGEAVYAQDQCSIKCQQSIIGRVNINTQSICQLSTCQLTRSVLAGESSNFIGTDVYFATEDSSIFSIYASSGSKIKFDTVNVVEGLTYIGAAHGLIDVKSANTDKTHRVEYLSDEQSTISFPNAVKIKQKATSSNHAETQATAENKPTGQQGQSEATKAATKKESAAEKGTSGKETALSKLHALIGLSKVKDAVDKMIKLKRFDQKRIEQGQPSLHQSLHAAFLGNPGTGKTTVARLVGQIMYEEGVLPSKNYVEVSQQDLISSNMGQTAELTMKQLQKAEGGVLFIDEAYTLFKKNYRQQGQEAVDTILKYMEDHRDSLMIIFAGYTKEMQDFFDMNPGLRSRIANNLTFEDYTPEEIVQMGEFQLKKDHFKYNRDYYAKTVEKAYKQSIDHSNGRWIRNFNEKLEKQVADRIMSSGSADDDVSLIKDEDLDALAGGDVKKKEQAVNDLLQQLDDLTGLKQVKSFVHDLVDKIKLEQSLDDDALTDSKPTYHMIFSGPAGTGKTTVARIIAKLFYNLDVLPKDTVIETNREGLVGQYVGDTEAKTKKVIRDALGGVLFVDEAYQLSDDKFGKQAVGTFITALENYRDKFVVIFAGYTEEMNQFLRINSGLSSRIPLRFNFEAYTPEEVATIVESILAKKWQFNHDLLRKIVIGNYKMLAKADQGNARWARTFAESLVEKHKTWLSSQKDISETDHLKIDDSVVQSMSTVMGDAAQDKDTIVKNVLAELDGMTGLTSVKTYVHGLVEQVKTQKRLSEQLGESSKPTYHMIFTGPAGTGKTTVARLIAKLFYALDILPRDTVKEVTRADLVGQYIGQTESRTQETIDDAMGGVLFIDEAYQLNSPGFGNDFGKEVINTLLTNLENHRDEFVAIFAGYTDEMQHFLDQNSGLRSRIPITLEFEPYTADEVASIAVANLAKNWEFNHDLVKQIAKQNYQMLTKKDQGNGRWARTFSETIVQKHQQWLSEHPEVQNVKKIDDAVINSMSTVEGDGAESKEAIVNSVLTELDGMIGLESVKNYVHQLVKRIKVNKLLSEKLGDSSSNTYHMVFTGPAGTGKTTVARLIAKLFYALDILPRNTVKEVTRADLVGQYIGQTESRTQETIDDAMGGVLFIDEAYQLNSPGFGNDFGKEVINTLLTNLENHRDEFVAIFAGYTENMQTFLDQNSGLRSRIPITLNFDPYTSDEVAQIVQSILAKKWIFDEDVLHQSVVQKYDALPEKEKGNGRWARNCAAKIDNAHRLWLADHLDTEDIRKINSDVIQSAINS